MITTQQLQDAIALRMRPHLRVTGELSDSFAWIVEALRISTECVAPVIRTFTTWHIVFGRSPFVIESGTGTLTSAMKDEPIIADVEHMIFIDAERISRYRPEMQVVAVLEELVHVCLNIRDEALTSQVVVALYPAVWLVDGKYMMGQYGHPG